MSNRAKIVAIVLWSLVAVALIAVLVLYFTTDLFSSLSWKREPHIVYETTLEGDTREKCGSCRRKRDRCPSGRPPGMM